MPPEVAREGLRLLMDDVNNATAAALEERRGPRVRVRYPRRRREIRPSEMLQDPRVTYHGRSRAVRDGKNRWMPDLDENIDGLMLMGHHGKRSTPNAFLPHTWSLEWADFRINGQSVGEIGIEACYAGYWNIPLALVHGDDAACRENGAQFPGAVTANVKRAVDHDLATGPDPAAARELTARKVAEAIRRIEAGEPRPYKPALPMRVECGCTPSTAYAAAAKP